MTLEPPAVAIEGAIEVFVAGRPVPWSTPDVGKDRRGRRRARKDPRLVAWQWAVHVQALAARGAQAPARGPMALCLAFRLASPDPAAWGHPAAPPLRFDRRSGAWRKAGRALADLTNLTKAVEDALQGAFYVDDAQVRWKFETCSWAPAGDSGCRIIAAALAPGRPPSGGVD